MTVDFVESFSITLIEPVGWRPQVEAVQRQRKHQRFVQSVLFETITESSGKWQEIRLLEAQFEGHRNH